LLNGSEKQVLAHVKQLPDPDHAFLKYVLKTEPNSEAEKLIFRAAEKMAREQVEEYGRKLKIKDGCPKKNVSEYDFRRCVTKKYNQLHDLNIPFF
jgi:hypothetical protein